jgi:hypothetical protein
MPLALPIISVSFRYEAGPRPKLPIDVHRTARVLHYTTPLALGNEAKIEKESMVFGNSNRFHTVPENAI